MITLARRDDVRAEVVLERSERIKVGAVTAVEGVHGGGCKLLLEEVILRNSCLYVHWSIHKAWLVCIVGLADSVFIAGREIAGARITGMEGVKNELLLLLLQQLLLVLLLLLQLQSLLLVVLL